MGQQEDDTTLKVHIKIKPEKQVTFLYCNYRNSNLYYIVLQRSHIISDTIFEQPYQIPTGNIYTKFGGLFL